MRCLERADADEWHIDGPNLSECFSGRRRLDRCRHDGARRGPRRLQFDGSYNSQLYSTASYQAENLQGISLVGTTSLGGATRRGKTCPFCFSNATLTSCQLFSSQPRRCRPRWHDLANAILRDANLQDADLPTRLPCRLNRTARICEELNGFDAPADRHDEYHFPDGTIQGLNLSGSNSLLTIRDYTGLLAPIPIHVTGGMTVAAGGTLQFMLGGPTWSSTMSFDSGIPVSLGGVLDLQAPGVDPPACSARASNYSIGPASRRAVHSARLRAICRRDTLGIRQAFIPRALST